MGSSATKPGKVVRQTGGVSVTQRNRRRGDPISSTAKEAYLHTPQKTPEAHHSKAQQVNGVNVSGKKSEAPIKELKLTIQRLIDKNNVMIFSNSTCPQCAKIMPFFLSSQDMQNW